LPHGFLSGFCADLFGSSAKPLGSRDAGCRGGMGAVYQARQIELDRLFAIKLLPLEVSVDQDFADRFRREARAMAKLHGLHAAFTLDQCADPHDRTQGGEQRSGSDREDVALPAGLRRGRVDAGRVPRCGPRLHRLGGWPAVLDSA